MTRATFRHRLEYLALVAPWRLLRSMPPSLVGWIARRIGGLLHVTWKSRREIAARNVPLTLGLAPDDGEARRIVRGAFNAYAFTLVEPSIMHRLLDRGTAAAHVEIEGRHHFEAARATGKGILLCSGHIGAWILGPAMHGAFFEPVHVVLRPPNNPLVTAFLEDYAGPLGVKTWIDRRHAAREILRLLKGGEVLLVLLDQRPRAKVQSGALDFMGRPTPHDLIPGRLALRTGAVAVPYYVLRQAATGHWRVVFEAPMEARTDLDPGAAELDLTRRLSESLAAQVREHPDQWNWLHDRWAKLTGKGPAKGPGGTQAEPAQGTTEG